MSASGRWAFAEHAGDAAPKNVVLRLVYGGQTAQERSDVGVIPWHEIQGRPWV
jgi:hypothetical protein